MSKDNGSQKPEAPQNFETPHVFVSDAVKNLQHNPTFLEESLDYTFFKQIHPVERIDSNRPIKKVQFHFK